MSALYEMTARALTEADAHGKSLKSALYALFPGRKMKREVPAILALASHCSLRLPVLKKCLSAIGAKGKASARFGLREYRMMAMIYDLLYTGKISGGGQLKRTLLSKRETLEQCRQKTEAELKRDGRWQETSAVPVLPRYLRVDLSRWTRAEALTEIRAALGLDDPLLTPDAPPLVSPDPLLDNCLILPPKIYDRALRECSSLKDGRVTMMDRATCLSARAAEVEAGDIVLDICAAPGSKSLAFLSELNRSGILICVEKDNRRFGSLVSRLAREFVFDSVWAFPLGDKSASACELQIDDSDHMMEVAEQHAILFKSSERPLLQAMCLKCDFLTTTSCSQATGACSCGEKYCFNRLINFMTKSTKRRRCVLSLDPSCSGSGLPEHAKEVREKEKMKGRVLGLQEFQSKMLEKALSLPLVSRCLYSTCSVWFEENEEVVDLVLRSNEKWKIGTPTSCRLWESSCVEYLVDSDNGKGNLAVGNCLRASISQHQCRGFFLAPLDRIG